ncbi:hypothetical protein PHYSODRAFT_288481 [Phytophthora sojae]|uniref:RxLR effector protein n=2 Tax=Phytophthora sojae TaxID=67593 RepID=G5A4Z4_PHYSP|nr:hypothetical protein PHYSODRAFT_288481 [Phytophthora sojae]AEK80495.1 Avh21 [Phytophthora sojae]AEK80496.1 Avh21 [Phytophthora sojae]AEK80497.1 Avh21 [Phytophthora sojae]EGZ09743.1 hypothetical protein PHYSODRAFT_288481 [Phytophthora sojae]|eukprot:XP_009534604.1 hypothetical protein PHYSODRAFT_288481 [Phytophthora sojae]
MRLAFIFALVIAATLHVSGASLPSANKLNAGVKNDASPAATDLFDADGGRMLRRVEKYEDIGEERGFSVKE